MFLNLALVAIYTLLTVASISFDKTQAGLIDDVNSFESHYHQSDIKNIIVYPFEEFK